MITQKVVVITGASSGIGKALAERYAHAGYKLALAARNIERLQKAAELLPTDSLLVTCDVSQMDDCQQLIRQTIERFGRIDTLINNAGISMRALFQDVSLEVLHQVMDINFWGSVYCTKFALPYLQKTQGSIIGISSIAGHRGLPARSGYSASKFAMNGFLEAIRAELLPDKVHVLTVSPGFTASNIRKVALNAQGSQQGESPRDETNMMSAEAVAEAVFKAQQKRKHSIILTTQGKLTVFLNKWFSKWMDKKVLHILAQEPDTPLKTKE